MHGIDKAEDEHDQRHRPEKTQIPLFKTKAEGQEYDYRKWQDLQKNEQETSQILAQEQCDAARRLGERQVNRSLAHEFREDRGAGNEGQHHREQPKPVRDDGVGEDEEIQFPGLFRPQLKGFMFDGPQAEEERYAFLVETDGGIPQRHHSGERQHDPEPQVE